LTGAKVFRVIESFDEWTEAEDPPPSWRPRKTSPIPYSQLFYGRRVQFRKELRTVYLCSPQQITFWGEPRLAAKLVPPHTKVQQGNGIHAYRTLRQAVAAWGDLDHKVDHPGEHAAYAIVRPDGDMAIGEFGWVAAAATIIRIYLAPSDYLSYARILYDRYRVPVEVLPVSLRQVTIPEPEDPPVFQVWNRRYGPESGAYLIWKGDRWKLRLPRSVRRPANLALWDADVAAIGALRLALRMTRKDRGRLGGLAHGKALRLGAVALSGAAVAHPTICQRCGELLPSARQAWSHCRTGKPGRPARANSSLNRHKV
jgi:hypothetical protein